MIDVQQSSAFSEWLRRLRDSTARDRILVRIRRLQGGHFGDVRAVGDGVAEMRIDYGPGYRIYFIRSGEAVVILLSGGDKRMQDADIARAKQMAKELRR